MDEMAQGIVSMQPTQNLSTPEEQSEPPTQSNQDDVRVTC